MMGIDLVYRFSSPPRRAVPTRVSVVLNVLNLLTLSSLGSFISAAPATEPARATAPATAPAPSAKNKVVVDGGSSLDRTLPEVAFNGVGLDDVIDFFRDVSGAKVDVNWEALQAAGVKKDAAVTVKLTNVKLPRALQLVLESAGGKQARLHASVEDGRVLVTTWEDYVARYTEDRDYDVRDLIAPKGAGQKAAPADDIVGLIQDTVAPGSWVSAGGKPGVVKEKEGRLTITQTRENHRQIADLIRQIRERRSQPTTKPQPAASSPSHR